MTVLNLEFVGVGHKEVFFALVCFSTVLRKEPRALHKLGKASQPLSYTQILFSRSYLFVVSLRCPCGSDMLVGLRIPGLYQCFLLLPHVIITPGEDLHNANFVPHPQSFWPGLAFAFCTNSPIFMLLVFEDQLLEVVVNYYFSTREDLAFVSQLALVNELEPFWFGHPGTNLLTSDW